MLPESAICQDTFSIVAIDTLTGEVGSAGASCVDLSKTALEAGFISQLFPGLGAINTQSYYQPLNQQHAAEQLEAGKTPQEIIEWLKVNDVQNKPSIRQYGVVRLGNQTPNSAAFTGEDCMEWKGHKTGPNYSIQGNILLAPAILDSMESRFLRTEGSLAEKLMYSLQGANISGADKRCLNGGTSSHFAFIKVAKVGDSPNNLFLDLGVKTGKNSGIEPIDSLQSLFDDWKSNQQTSEDNNWEGYIHTYSNNQNGETIIGLHFSSTLSIHCTIFNNEGELISTFSCKGMDIHSILLKPGIYYMEVTESKRKPFVKKFLVP